MSGHSKWHNIQAKKGKADAARGRIFTKLGREIAVAARNNPNPSTNSKLADIIAKAKAANMPNDNIERSIKRAAGELGDKDYKDLTYEGYGVGGAAVIISTLTDNNNRTAGDIRAIMSKHGGSLGTTGSVSYMFDNKANELPEASFRHSFFLDVFEQRASHFRIIADDIQPFFLHQ